MSHGHHRDATPSRSHKVDVDPVTLDIVENALRNARYEMDEVLFRTALSPGIREQHDEFPMIANDEGKMMVGQFGLSIPDFLDDFDGTRGGRRPADLRPVLVRGRDQPRQRLARRAADLRRRPDRGLGLHVRPHVRRRREDPRLDADRRPDDLRGGRGRSRPSSSTRRASSTRTRCGSSSTRSRKPDWNRADLNGIVAACRTAARRIAELCARFGVDTYNSALDALLERNYRAMKALLAMVFTEGETLEFTDYICDDGVGYGPYELGSA